MDNTESVCLGESGIFHRSHTAVITVIAPDTNNRGTGLPIDSKEYLGTRTTVRFGITAFHVVKGARNVHVFLYKDGDGNWKNEKCQAVIYHVDIPRDVAILTILQTRISDVNAGEMALIIGDSTSFVCRWKIF